MYLSDPCHLCRPEHTQPSPGLCDWNCWDQHRPALLMLPLHESPRPDLRPRGKDGDVSDSSKVAKPWGDCAMGPPFLDPSFSEGCYSAGHYLNA